MHIALAHDSFTQLGGAERVIASLHRLYPEAPVYTTVVDPLLGDEVKDWEVKETMLRHLFRVYPNFQHLLFFIPAAIADLRVDKQVQILLSSSSSFIKALRKPKGAIHISYCHTPTRFLWSEPEYVRQEVPLWLRPVVGPFLRWMKKWDLDAAKRVDYFIANSKEVQQRIKKYYNRDSEIIYPFINTHFWRPTREKQDYFLIAGRLHAHKSNDLIIKLFNESGVPLHVVGTGRQEAYLRSIAKPNITFLGRVSDEALRDEYSGARAFFYPQFEDIGLMALEAAACGTATIGLAKGGNLETIIPGKTGELFAEHDMTAIQNIISNWDHARYATEDLRAQAEQFSEEVFQENIRSYVSEVYNRHFS